jgi:hypothetical protein
MTTANKTLVQKIAISMFILMTIAFTTKENTDYSKWLVNDFNSNYLKDKKHHYYKPIIEEKFLLDSIMKNLPPSSDTTYLIFSYNWCSEFEITGLTRIKSFGFKYSEMTKDSFQFKKHYSHNGIRRNKYFEIKNIKSTPNIKKMIDIFQNRDSLGYMDNPSYCIFHINRLMAYWTDTSNNFRYAFFGFKRINGSIKLLQLTPNDTMITKERTNKLNRIRF